MSAILSEDPTSISQLAPSTPPALERVVHRCLEKNPEQRFQSASDLAFALDALSDSGGTASAVASSAWRFAALKWMALALASAAIIVVSYLFSVRTRHTIDTRNLAIRLLTEHGQAVPWACVSPDGKLVAYIKRERERSLHVKQVLGGSDIEVVPPQPGYFGADYLHSGIAFSSDGNYIYYTHDDPTNRNNLNIYSVPTLGGQMRRIVSGVAGGFGLSPDGSKIAYWRPVAGKDEEWLFIAGSDGTDEHLILRQPNALPISPSWSKNDLIAVFRLELNQTALSSIVVLTPAGKIVNALPMKLLGAGLAWLPDSSGLFFLGADNSAGFRSQIWFQPYPAGPPLQISNDLNMYRSLSITADGKTLVSTQRNPSGTLEVAESPPVFTETSLWNFRSVPNEKSTAYHLSWTPDDKLLAINDGNREYLIETEGSNRIRLFENDVIFGATACGPDSLIIFSRFNTKNNAFHLWRSDVSGQDARQLTFGEDEETQASCTPDGKWIVYNGQATDHRSHIYRLSTDGGEPLDLAVGDVFEPAVSPDGKMVVYGRNQGEGATAEAQLVIQSIEGGPPIQAILAPAGFFQPGWVPGSRAVTYIHNSTGSAVNLFMQPLPSGKVVQLTHFNTEPSFLLAYAWSRDGQHFAVSRSRYNDTDVVMFSGFK
jgi:Tol biopolymer transport system component